VPYSGVKPLAVELHRPKYRVLDLPKNPVAAVSPCQKARLYTGAIFLFCSNTKKIQLCGADRY